MKVAETLIYSVVLTWGSVLLSSFSLNGIQIMGVYFIVTTVLCLIMDIKEKK